MSPCMHNTLSHVHISADIAAYVNYSLEYRIFPAPSKTIEGLQAVANIAVGVSFTITAPVPRLSIFTETEYSFVTVTKLDLGIKDRCVTAIRISKQCRTMDVTDPACTVFAIAAFCSN